MEQEQQNETTEAPRAKERNSAAVMGAFLSSLRTPQRDAKHTERLRAKVRGHIERMFPEAEAELGFASATNAARQEGGYDAARRIVARDQLVGRISACMVDPTTMGFRHVGPPARACAHPARQQFLALREARRQEARGRQGAHLLSRGARAREDKSRSAPRPGCRSRRRRSRMAVRSK